MNLLLCIFAALLLAGCNSIKPNAQSSLDQSENDQTIASNILDDSRIAALLRQSKTINSSPDIARLRQQAEKNTNLPEPLYALAYAHIKHAQATQNIAELNLAANYLTQILRLLPGNQAVVTGLYNIYYDDLLHNRNPEALHRAQQLLRQMPESAQATMNPPSLAKFVATVRQQEAQRQPNRQLLRTILLQAIQEQPRNDNAYIQLAKIYSEDRYFALAIATLKLAAENISNSVELYQAIAATYEKRALNHNCHYEHPGDIANASKYYKLAIALTPDNQQLHYNLADALLDQHHKFLGLNESSIALELNPTSRNLSITARDYALFGYPQKANQLLAQAVAKGMSIGDSSYHEINMNQGNWQEAAKGFAAYAKQQQKFSVYDLIKSDIIAQQAYQSPWLTQDKITASNQWEENLLNYWNSTISDQSFKKTAYSRCEKTEYYFYSGYKDLRNGQTLEAKEKFTAALKQNTYRFIERPLAQYFLQK